VAIVECALCGRKVNTTKDNYVFANGIHQHKHCPATSTILSDGEKRDYKSLTDAIQWINMKDNLPLNWSLIASQIKRMKEIGYSYSEQLYALKYCVSMSKYWGYGGVEKYMPHAMAQKKKEEDYEKAKQTMLESNTEVKQIKSKSFLDI
jgi:hypothetical protein